MEEIARDIEKRDYQDMHREHSPLKKAEDALYLDSSEMSVREVVDAIIDALMETLMEKRVPDRRLDGVLEELMKKEYGIK